MTSKDEVIEYRNQRVAIPDVPYTQCAECGFEFAQPKQSKVFDACVRNKRREIDGLLSADEIRSIRKALNFSQEEASELFGGGPNSFSKYERADTAQSVAMDNLIRLVGEFPILLERLMWFNLNRKIARAEVAPTDSTGTRSFTSGREWVFELSYENNDQDLGNIIELSHRRRRKQLEEMIEAPDEEASPDLSDISL